MTIFKRVLFPVDLSEASTRMVPIVKEIVDSFGAELQVMHVKSADHYYIPTFVDETRVKPTADEEDRLQRFVEAHFEDPDIPTRVLTGSPGPEIVGYVEHEDMDLIAMGHSSTGIARAVFGSVAGYVAKYSPAPVLIISPSILKRQ